MENQNIITTLSILRNTQSVPVQDVIDSSIDKQMRDEMQHINFKFSSQAIDLFDIVYSYYAKSWTSFNLVFRYRSALVVKHGAHHGPNEAISVAGAS